MSRIYQKFSGGKSGWYYKYKNYRGGPYNNQKEAEASLMVRIIDTKPQRGRSDPLSVKP